MHGSFFKYYQGSHDVTTTGSFYCKLAEVLIDYTFDTVQIRQRRLRASDGIRESSSPDRKRLSAAIGTHLVPAILKRRVSYGMESRELH